MPNLLFCTTCKTTYDDQTLAFCLNDGTRLVPLGNNAEQTVQMSGQTNPVRPNFPNSEPTIQANSFQPKSAPPPKRGGAGLIIAVLVVGFLGLIAVVGAIGAYFMLSDSSSEIVTNSSPTPVVTPLQTNSNSSNAFDKADALTKELEEKLNRLEKQLEAQKRNNQANAAQNQSQTQNQSAIPTAKVNSPNDGFLALRSLPNTETGAQLVKIPHGATVVLNNCEKNTVKVGGRNGRWCQVEYAGKMGWVFSAWLDY